MPIMNVLKSINRREEAGFTPNQAKTVVEIVEQGLQTGFDRFVEVLDRKNGELELRVRADIHELRAELLKEQRDLLLKYTAIVSIVAAVFGLILKLTGN